MNKQQFKIVKDFLKMGSEPQSLAKEFKIKLTEVLKVQQSNNFEDYQSPTDNPLDDFFGFKGGNPFSGTGL